MKANEALTMAKLASNEQINQCIKLIIDAAMKGCTEVTVKNLQGGTVAKLQEYGYDVSYSHETYHYVAFKVSWGISI